jgi:hypothetical protein
VTWTAGSAVATGTVTTAPPPPGGLTVFGEFRTRVAATLQAALDAAGNDEITVIADVVDAVVPPAYLLVWPQSDDWLIPMTNCADTTRLDIICVGGRFEPSGGVEQIETLVALALPALRLHHLPVPRVAGPGRFDIGGVAYLAAQLTLSVPLAVGGP